MKKIRRTLAVLLALIMFVQPMVFAASVSDFSDFPSGWSSEAMTAAVENGLFVGMEDGKIHPQDNLTRAQLAAFITRAFGATIEADISILEDVKPADWFYHDVAKAYNMGALTGKSDTTFIPDAEITREEVFVVIGRTLCITSDNYDILNHFTDSANISDWAKPAISGLLAKGYINGYPDGTLLPKGNITREELAQLFHNIFRTYISEPGYHTAVNKPGSVMVRVPGVILESVSVDGDVVIADGVGAGNFDINTVTVGGRLLARGGEGYVTVKNTKIGESVVVFDRNGTVNFYNYRDEAPFKVLYEYTPATFLTKKAEEVISGGGGSSSGGKAITRYTVKFDYPEGMSDKTIYVRKNYYAEVPTAIPAIEGKNFMYWSADTDDTPFNFEGTQITKDYTFHPVFEILVPLYAPNGDLITTLHIKDGDTISESMLEPYIPEKEGYDFDKWVDEDGDPYDFSTPVTGPIELKPSYTIKTFTTVFTDENGDPIPGTEQVIDWNTPATIIPADPTCSDDTKEFAYWTVNGNPVDPATYPITEGTTFVPYFTDKPVHTVTFGKVDPDDYSYDGTTTLGTIEGFPMNIPTLPMPEGYEVKYWTDTPGTDALDTTAPAYDTTNPVTDDGIVLYPVIGKQIKTITFNDPNGDPIPGSTDIPVEYGDPIPAANIPADPTSTDPSKEFAGWSVDGGATTIDDITTYPIKGDVEFTPVFKTKQFAVKFMADSLIVDSQNIDYGTCATAPADPSKTGYTFGGWTIDGINPVDVAAYTITDATTFNAIMTANTYTVTLNTNGGTINSGDVTEYTYGTGATLPTDVTKPGHTFDGWYDNADLTGYPVTSIPADATENKTFYAKYTPETYEVKYLKEDGTELETVSATYGEPIPAPSTTPTSSDPTKEFAGWSVDGVTPIDLNTYPIDADTELKPVFTDKDVFVVTFKTFDGTNYVDYTTVNAVDGLAVAAPADPTLTGYDFNYWSETEGGAEFDMTTPITADKTLYAKFTVQQYEVKYLKEDGTELETVTATYGEPIPTPSTTPTSSDPTKEFAGWSVDGVTPIDLDTYPIDADTELKPVFTDKDVFVVTFKTFDGTNYVDYTTVNAVDGLAVAAPADPTLTGYDFKFWTETPGGTEFDMTTAITADKTLYAYFTAQQYEVKYLKEDGTELETVTATYGEPIPAPSTTPTSSDPAKEFAGWSVDGVTPIDLDTYPISADTELKPVFTDKDTFTVTFKTFDGTNYVDYTTVPAVDGLAVAAPADPALTGYTFKYWSETEGGAEFDMTTPITADKTLYAVFEAAQFTVTFYAEDGTTVIGTAQTVDYGDYAVAETAPEVTGKAFKYWTVDGSEVDPDTYAITEDTDFVAYYEDTVTVRFFDLSLDYDDQMISSKTVDVGDYLATTDVPDTFVHNGYKKNVGLASVYSGVDYTHEILEGWYYISGGKWVEFDPTQAIMNDIDVYMNCKKATAYLSIPAISSMPFPFKDWYRTDIRAFDSFKDTLFINETPTVVSFNTLVKDSVYGKLAEKNLITEAGEIKNFHRFVYIRDVLGNSGIETMIWDFIGNTVDEDGEFRDYIREKLTSVTPSTKAKAINAVKSSFNTLLAGPKANNFRNGVKSIVKDAAMNDEEFLKSVIKMYCDIKSATSAGKTEMQGVLEGILDAIGTPEAADYKAQVPTLVSDPKAQRDAAIDDIVAMLDASTISALSSLLDTLVSGILSTTSIDDAFANTLLDYMGEPANAAKLDAMVTAIVNNLDSETLTTIATILGHSGTCRKTELVNEFIRELENEDLATVTDENSFMFDPIIAKLGNYTFDKLWAKVPAKFQSLLPKEYLKDMFNRFYEPYVNSMKDAVANAHADPTGKYYFGTGINIEINPVSDIIKPAFEYYFTAKGFVIGKLSTSHYSTYLTYYNNNPYVDAYEEFLSVDKWFDGSDAGYTPELSGYSLKSFDEYYKIVEAFADIIDDAMMCYYDDANVPAAAREAVFDALKARICGALNMICRFIEDYEANGIPTSLTELVLDLEDDPEMIEYINKFGVKKYLDKIAGISYADKAYATVEARLDARISALFTKFVSTKLDRYYNDGEYNKAKEVLANLFCAEPGYTVDSLFTEVFGGADSGEVGVSGIKFRFERGYEIPVTHSDIR